MWAAIFPSPTFRVDPASTKTPEAVIHTDLNFVISGADCRIVESGLCRYVETQEAAKLQQPEMWDGEKSAGRLGVFEKGQSRRIWGELYKVVDSSDVVIQVCTRQSLIVRRP